MPASPSQQRALARLAPARIRDLPPDALVQEAARVWADVEMAALLGERHTPVGEVLVQFSRTGYLTARDDERLRHWLLRYRERLVASLAS